MHDESLLVPGSRWFHAKTGDHYTVDCVATCSTNGEREDRERSVVYWSDAKREKRYREVSQFLDGRFTPVTPKPMTEREMYEASRDCLEAGT